MFKYMFVPIRYINQREIICIVLFGREDINFEPFELLLYYIAGTTHYRILTLMYQCIRVFCCCSFVLFNEKDCLIQFSHFLGSKIKYCTELFTIEASYILTQGS